MDFKSNLEKLRNFLKEKNLDYIIINSTDEFLNEYNALENNSRYAITGFSGSTGDALVSKDSVYLYVDGRYHQQADNEVDHSTISVVKLEMGTSMLDSVIETIGHATCKLAIISSKTSITKYNKLKEHLKNTDIVELELDPVIDNRNKKQANTRILPKEIYMQDTDSKLECLAKDTENIAALIITSLEEIAYLTNLRSSSIPFSSSFGAKAIVKNKKLHLYCDADTNEIESKPLDDFENDLKDIIKDKDKAGIDFGSCNLQTYRQVEQATSNIIEIKQSPISKMKAIKNSCEIAHMKECFLKTDIVVSRAATWINQCIKNKVEISEKDLSSKVKQYFKEEGAYGLSFETIAASGSNSSIIHYCNPDKNKIIKEGELVLLDCGAYFEGGYATDITRTFLAGNSVSQEQKNVYTKVLKALLTGLNYRCTRETTGFDIDKAVRDKLCADEKFKFSHGTGHGVGISVHECPPNISPSENAKQPLLPGMVFTIEPGLYCENWGGVRLENTVYLDENYTIKSLARYKFDEKLINYDMLDEQEKNWLKSYNRKMIS